MPSIKLQVFRTMGVALQLDWFTTDDYETAALW